MLIGKILSAFVWLAVCGILNGQSAVDRRVERLAAAGRLWATMRYLHPWIAYRSINWDEALVRSIPQINHSVTGQEYAAAVQGMLDRLNDPATRVIRTSPPIMQSTANPDPTIRWTADNILIFSVHNYADLRDYYRAQARAIEVRKGLERARGIIFDLRSSDPEIPAPNSSLSLAFLVSFLTSALSTTPIETPGQRAMMYSGYPFDRSSNFNGYSSGFHTVNGWLFRPNNEARDRPLVFIINAGSDVPPIALGLQHAGKAGIVFDGASTDAPFIRTQQFDLTDGLSVRFRLSDLLFPDGDSDFSPDAVVLKKGAGGGDEAFEKALTLIHSPPAAAPRRGSPSPVRTAITYEEPYAEMKFPSAEYRLLALFRIWGVARYFFAYKDISGEDWDALLLQYIPRMEAALDATEYALTVAELAARFHDSHAGAFGGAFLDYIGNAQPQIEVRMIEGQPVITELSPEAKAVGANRGDIVVKVDRVSAAGRIVRLSKYVSGSTPEAVLRKVAGLLLSGPDGNAVVVELRGSDGRTRTVTLPSSQEYARNPYGRRRTGDIVRLLSGKIGYVDLDRLPGSMVTEMFEKLKNTSGIIFDDRGYPQVTGVPIASRLALHPNVESSISRRPVVMASLSDDFSGDVNAQSAWRELRVSFQASAAPRYKGKTVLLIDERTQSQAEGLGMEFKAANGTMFIGSPTSGANGSATGCMLPGGIRFSFTGERIMWPDGRQLQRVGLVPDIEVRPTIGGVREGRDEILERAVRHLSEKR